MTDTSFVGKRVVAGIAVLAGAVGASGGLNTTGTGGAASAGSVPFLNTTGTAASAAQVAAPEPLAQWLASVKSKTFYQKSWDEVKLVKSWDEVKLDVTAKAERAYEEYTKADDYIQALIEPWIEPAFRTLIDTIFSPKVQTISPEQISALRTQLKTIAETTDTETQVNQLLAIITERTESAVATEVSAVGTSIIAKGGEAVVGVVGVVVGVQALQLFYRKIIIKMLMCARHEKTSSSSSSLYKIRSFKDEEAFKAYFEKEHFSEGLEENLEVKLNTLKNKLDAHQTIELCYPFEEHTAVSAYKIYTMDSGGIIKKVVHNETVGLERVKTESLQANVSYPNMLLSPLRIRDKYDIDPRYGDKIYERVREITDTMFSIYTTDGHPHYIIPDIMMMEQ